MNLTRNVKKLAELIIEKVSNIKEVNGRSPISIAAACIYLAAEASGNSRSYDDISAIAGAAVTTIKSTLKHMQLSNITVSSIEPLLASINNSNSSNNLTSIPGNTNGVMNNSSSTKLLVKKSHTN